MNFNVQLKALAVAACALLAACNSHEVEMPTIPDNNSTVECGDPISLSAERAVTRTSFGEVADGVVPIYWAENDQITLYCPQATTTTEDITFTNVAEKTRSHEITTSKMTWGTTSTHDFYATYPATTIATDGSVALSMPSMQTASGSAAPDMKLAKMVAAKSGVPTASKSVNMPFTPAFSVLDITFTASESVTISRIVVSSTDGTPVAGDYTASFNGSKWTFNTTTDATKRSSLMAIQINGTAGITLAAGATARFYAFLLPVEYAGLRVDLLTPDGKVVGRSTQNVTFGAAKRYGINLGTLPASSAWKSTYGTWMKYIPDNVLVSDLSIPGTHDAATYNITKGFLEGNSYICQSKDFNTQLAGGVRLFDLRPGGSDLMIYHSSKSTKITLSTALGYMKTYITNNPTEGCIAFIKNENSWTDTNVSPTLATYASNMVNYTEKLTVGQLRGKILVISRNNYPGTIYGGNFSTGWPDNTSGGSVGIGYNQSTWTETFWLQDQYDSGTSESTKLASFKAYVDKAHNNKATNEWLCNHTSLAGVQVLGAGDGPKEHADYLNPQAVSYINSTPGRLGIIMMDFAGDSNGGDQLVNAVINQNVRYAQGIK